MKDVLGITPRDVKETIVEEANILIEKGLVKKTKRVRCQGAAASADGDTKTEEATEKDGENKDDKGEEKPKENGDVKDEDGEKKDVTEEGQGDEKGKELAGDNPGPQEEKTEDTPTQAAEARAEN